MTDLYEAVEEWRAARQAIFDRASIPQDKQDPNRWKRLSDAEHRLMEVANGYLHANHSDHSTTAVLPD